MENASTKGRAAVFLNRNTENEKYYRVYFQIVRLFIFIPVHRWSDAVFSICCMYCCCCRKNVLDKIKAVLKPVCHFDRKKIDRFLHLTIKLNFLTPCHVYFWNIRSSTRMIHVLLLDLITRMKHNACNISCIIHVQLSLLGILFTHVKLPETLH